MSDSREESPDWLRSFQPSAQSTIELSSESELPSDHSPHSDDDEDSIKLSKLFKKGAKQASTISDNNDGRESEDKKPDKGKSPKKNGKVKRTPEKKRKNEDDSEREGKRVKGKDSSRRNTPDKHGKPHKYSIWALSSDSEYSPNARPGEKDKARKWEISPDKDLIRENIKESDDISLVHAEKSTKAQTSKLKLPMRQTQNEDGSTSNTKNINSDIKEESDTKNNFVKDGNSEKHRGPQGSSTNLPLVLSDKVQRSKALVECEGDSIDLSGDVGSVGRIVISEDPSKNHEMLLDLKGTFYKTTIVPSRTFCVVSFGQSEAKIEAIMNDYIQLKPQFNVYEAETMVEGILDGFSFDSEEEADKTMAPTDQHEDAEEQADGKTKGKPSKTPGPAKKKGKAAAGKPPKKLKKKPQVTKKGKTKK